MSNALPVPCVKQSAQAHLRRLHYSTAMAYTGSTPGRSGMALCGERDVIDHTRAGAVLTTPIRLHELTPCDRCQHTLAYAGLTAAARRALAYLINV